MSAGNVEILKLLSVLLTQTKQDRIKEEFDKYTSATNYVLTEILEQHLTSASQAVDALREEFTSRFDPRVAYLEDVVRTARVKIGQHRAMARSMRSLRNKTPYFEEDKMIFSKPIIKVKPSATILFTADDEEIAIPYDKRTRNRNMDILTELASGKRDHGRVRLTWKKAGYVGVDIRVEGEKLGKPEEI
ncbi:MAG: hypothetical protein R6V83_14550 [Candidatus Thorarchaeota archaeon]